MYANFVTIESERLEDATYIDEFYRQLVDLARTNPGYQVYKQLRFIDMRTGISYDFENMTWSNWSRVNLSDVEPGRQSYSLTQLAEAISHVIKFKPNAHVTQFSHHLAKPLRLVSPVPEYVHDYRFVTLGNKHLPIARNDSVKTVYEIEDKLMSPEDLFGECPFLITLGADGWLRDFTDVYDKDGVFVYKTKLTMQQLKAKYNIATVQSRV